MSFSRMTVWKPFKRIIADGSHSGAVQVTLNNRSRGTYLRLITTVGAVAGIVGLNLKVEQNDGTSWFTLGGFDIAEVSQQKYIHEFYEQTYRSDLSQASQWPTVHDYTFNGATYKQVELCPTLRITYQSTAPLDYSVDMTVDSRRLAVFP